MKDETVSVLTDVFLEVFFFFHAAIFYVSAYTLDLTCSELTAENVICTNNCQ